MPNNKKLRQTKEQLFVEYNNLVAFQHFPLKKCCQQNNLYKLECKFKKSQTQRAIHNCLKQFMNTRTMIAVTEN